MAQVMDIWNAMNREVASPVGPCGIGSNPTVLHLNRNIKQKTPRRTNKFLDNYIANNDLAHVYALSSACFEVIESVVPLFSHGLAASENDFGEIIEAELNCFDGIERVLETKRLAEELWEVANGEHWSQIGIETPDNMSKLGQLSYELQKRIEDGPWDLSEKTHAYMCSLTIGNFKKFDYESFTYQISRRVQCNETINNFVPYLQGEASGREALWAQRRFHVAEVLRLIQWAEIGNVSEYVRGFCDTIEIHSPQPVDEDFHDSVWKTLNTPFPLFRSDLALECLKDELTQYLCACQVWLEKACQKNEYSDDPLFHIARMTISAVYLFGAYRIGDGDFDGSTIERAGSYLQMHQQPDAAFLNAQQSPWTYLELNAMIVHALRISEAFGWRRTIDRAFEWIAGELDIYGVWYDFRFHRNGYLTGLLLDAISLAVDGNRLTFSMPQQKKSHPEIADDPVDQHAGNTVIEKYIFNILGNTFQSESAKPNKPPKNTQASKAKDTRIKYREWKYCGDACLEFTANDKVKFHYQDEATDLHLRHSGPVWELLMELKGTKCPRSFLENNDKLILTRKGTKRRLGDVVRRTNERLNEKVAAKVKTKGFSDIPDNIKFVGYDKQKEVYRFYIPTDTSDF